MLLRSFIPSPSLQEYIRSIGIVHFLFPKGSLIPPKPYAPRPETSLYFFPRDAEHVAYSGDKPMTKRGGPCVHGQHTRLHERHVGSDFLAVIVHFQPGVLHRLIGVPMEEITNSHLPADRLFDSEVNFVSEKIGECSSYKEMVSVVEGFVATALRRCRRNEDRIDRAAQYLLSHNNVSVDWLARECCLGARQFERKFKERNGVSASVLTRIIRFNRSMRLKNAQPSTDLLTVALQAGYYDYQHMAKDYREFTGASPNGFFNLESKAPERIFGLAEEDRLYPR